MATPCRCWSLACALASLIAANAFAQEPLLRFERIEAAEEFTNVRTLSIAQDQQGFLWFSSLGAGAARFDGYEFRVFQHDPANPASLADNEAHHVNVGPDGAVWIATAGGLNRFDAVTETFETFRHDPNNPDSIAVSYTTWSLIDNDGNLWVGTGDGLARRDAHQTRFRHYSLLSEEPHGLAPTFVETMLLDRKGVLWVGTLGGGLLRYDHDSDTFERFQNDPADETTLVNDNVRSIAEDRNGQLWIGTDNWLSRMDPSTAKFRSMKLEDGLNGSQIGPIVEDRSGKIWVAVYDLGLQRFDPDSGEFPLFSHNPADAGTLGPGNVWSLFEDSSGSLWIGTDVVNRLTREDHGLTQFANPLSNSRGAGRIPYAVVESNGGKIWLGGVEGVDRYDITTNDWKRYSLIPENPADRHNEVSALYLDRNNALWVANPRHLSRVDQDTGRHESAPINHKPNCIYVDTVGAVWLCMPFYGFVQFDYETQKEVKVYRTDETEETSLSHDFTTFAFEDRDGRFWVGSYNGLNRFDPHTGKFRRYLTNVSDPASISDNTVYAFYESPQGDVWFGTGFGLNRYVPATDGFESFLDGNGAKANEIHEIVAGNGNTMWVVNPYGLHAFDPAVGYLHSNESIIELHQPFGTAIRSRLNGNLYATTASGLVRIGASFTKTETSGPPVVLTDLRLFNRPVAIDVSGVASPLTAAINLLPEAVLGPRDSMLSIGFAAPESRDPARVVYSYRLDGYDSDWIETSANRRAATYTSLPAGVYQFRVRSSAADGDWGPEHSLKIKILPPWWQSYWAYSTYVLATVFMIWALIQLRTRALRLHRARLENTVRQRTEDLAARNKTIVEQTAELERLLNLKDRYIANISHEFRTPLTVILGPIDRLLSQTGNAQTRGYLEVTRRNASRLLRLVDKLLGLSQIESGQILRQHAQAIRPVVEHAVAALSSFADSRNIEISTDGVEDVWANCSDDVIEEVVVNLLSNAIKYSTPHAKVIVVAGNRHDGGVSIVVEDAGPGIPEHLQACVFERFYRADDIQETVAGSGLGLALIKELVEANGGTIELTSEVGQGSRFEVTLPAAAPVANQGVPASSAWKDIYAAERDASSQPGLEAKSVLPVHENSAHVLIIEDSKDLCQQIADTLGSDYSIHYAYDGQSGIQTAVDLIPDLVVCDIVLPGINGFEVTRQLKQDERTSHIPVLVLTALADQDSRLRGLGELADDYITKPFNEPELRQRVETALAIRAILRHRFAQAGREVGIDEAKRALPQRDQRFVVRVEKAMEENFQNAGFSTADFAARTAMSERQLQRKLRALTGMSPREYLRNYRLQRARALLQDGASVADAAFKVGFESQSYFAKCFKAQFDITPRQVLDHQGTEAGQSGN